MSALEKIIEQQKGLEDSPAWMIGEQLKELLRQYPKSEELLDRDLSVKGMGLADCEKRLQALADEKNRKTKKRCVVITPDEAQRVITEFYGLSGLTEAAPTLNAETAADTLLNLEDFL